jgi:hypothetical protein
MIESAESPLLPMLSLATVIKFGIWSIETTRILPYGFTRALNLTNARAI